MDFVGFFFVFKVFYLGIFIYRLWFLLDVIFEEVIDKRRKLKVFLLWSVIRRECVSIIKVRNKGLWKIL